MRDSARRSVTHIADANRCVFGLKPHRFENKYTKSNTWTHFLGRDTFEKTTAVRLGARMCMRDSARRLLT